MVTKGQRWYYAREGCTAGPVSWEGLCGLATSGEIAPSDLVCQDGEGHCWLPACAVPGLDSLFKTADAQALRQQGNPPRPRAGRAARAVGIGIVGFFGLVFIIGLIGSLFESSGSPRRAQGAGVGQPVPQKETQEEVMVHAAQPEGPAPSEPSKPSPSLPPPGPRQTAPVSTWQKVAAFKGKATKTTPRFTVGPEWGITWNTRPLEEVGPINFQIFICDGRGDLVGVAANVIGSDADESFHYKAGTYYLTINTMQAYVVEVWEKSAGRRSGKQYEQLPAATAQVPSAGPEAVESVGKEPAKKWSEVVTFTGSTNRTTEPFTVGSRWRIGWRIDYPRNGHFGLCLYAPPEKYLGLIVNDVLRGDVSETTNFYQGGQRYLEISAGGPYVVVVQEWR